jgi:hypothetical protein
VRTSSLATESASTSRPGGGAAFGPATGLTAPAALAALCGCALLASRVAEATGNLGGVAGALLARADVAAVVLVVAGAAMVVTPAVRRLVARRPPAPWGAHLTRWLVPLYAVWVPVVAMDLLAVDPERGWRAVAATVVLFRDPRGAPIAGLGIGPVLTILAMVVVLVPLAERALPRHRDRPVATLLVGAAGLAATGLAVRTVLVLGGWTTPFGALSWLPAHLDAVGAGLAVATLHVTGRLAADRRRIVPWAVAVAAVTLAVSAAVLPRAVLLSKAGDVWLQGLLYVVIAAACVLAASGVRAGRIARCLAVAAPGLVLVGEMAFITIARQHPEGLVEGPLGLRLTGAAVPTWLWSATIAAAGGVLLTVCVLVPLRRAMAGRWPRDGYPLVLAAVVSFGLLVRVVTWLKVAPAKTDGGDPFYYHVTANALAAGRGFPEPFTWLDSQTHLASAVHGPLYPVVLSLSSRLGGTTYVDHKFVSILIGTAVVLVTALVAGRLAGQRAAVIAGLLAAVYPNLWLLDSLLYPEGLFALLTTLCVLVAYQWRDRPTWSRAAVLGALIGLAGLTRGEGLLLGLLLAAPWILGNRDIAIGTRWRQLLLSGAACLVVIAPWTIRNVTAFDVFVPISTNSNELIMYANCADTYSGQFLGFWSYDCQQRYRAEHGEPAGDEAQKAAFWRDVGVRYARDHLDEVPKVVAARVLRQWELFRPWQNVTFGGIENRDRDASIAALLMYYALVALSIAGAVVLHRRGVRLLPLVAQVVSVTLTAAYAYGSERFRAPVEPVLCILAGVAVAALSWRTVRAAIGRRAAPAGAG